MRHPPDLRHYVLLRDAGVMEVEVKGPVLQQTSLAIDAAAAAEKERPARSA